MRAAVPRGSSRALSSTSCRIGQLTWSYDQYHLLSTPDPAATPRRREPRVVGVRPCGRNLEEEHTRPRQIPDPTVRRKDRECDDSRSREPARSLLRRDDRAAGWGAIASRDRPSDVDGDRSNGLAVEGEWVRWRMPRRDRARERLQGVAAADGSLDGRHADDHPGGNGGRGERHEERPGAPRDGDREHTGGGPSGERDPVDPARKAGDECVYGVAVGCRQRDPLAAHDREPDACERYGDERSQRGPPDVPPTGDRAQKLGGRRCGEERERRQCGQEVVAELPLRRREHNNRCERPAEEEAQPRIVSASAPPRAPECECDERRPGERDRRQVQRVEGQVVEQRLSRVGTAGGEPAREVPDVATDEVLVDEPLAPPGERDDVPAEPEDDECHDSCTREEATQPAQIPLPGEECHDRGDEQRRGNRPLRERGEPEDDERNGRDPPAPLAPPPKGEAEGYREQQREQHVRPRHAGVIEQRRRGRQEGGGDEARPRAEEGRPEGTRPRDEPGPGERGRQPDRCLREARRGAGEGGEPVIQDRLVGQQLVVEARPEPVAGDDVLDDPDLARLVVPDYVHPAEAVDRGGEVEQRDEDDAAVHFYASHTWRLISRLPHLEAQCRIAKPCRAPVGETQSTDTSLTRAPGGPRRAQAISASTSSRSPSISASTVPSGRFRTQPARPARSASSCIEPRYQTPWTRPRTTTWARTAMLRAEQAQEGVLVERRHFELLRARELRAGIRTDHDPVGLLADARDDAPAERLDPPLRFGPRHGREGAGEDELLPLERPVRAHDRRRPDAGLAQSLDHAPVLLLGEEALDRARHLGADVTHLLQLLLARVHDALERAEVLGQGARRGLAHLPDAERDQDLRQRRLLRALQLGEEILGGLLSHALQRDEVRLLQVVEIGEVPDEPFLDQLLDQLLAEALDVHCTAGAEEADRLPELRRAREPDAAVGDLALRAHDVGAADRTGRRHPEAPLVPRTPFGHDLHDVGDDVARALEQDRVPDADVLPLDLVHVVERRVPHRDPAHLDRLELRHRREDAGAADGGNDVHDPRRRLARLELERDRPARRARDLAEPALQLEVVHLDDQPVDLVAEAVARRLELVEEREDVVERREDAAHRHRPESHGRERLDRAPVGSRLEPADLAGAVADEGERAGRGDARVELLQRPRGRVPRVGEGRQPGLLPLPVELAERVDGQEHLAPRLEPCRRAAVHRAQAERDAADRADVRGDVLADDAVAARRAARERAVLVDQLDRDAVDLRLADVLDAFAAEETAHALVERSHLLPRRDSLRRMHRVATADGAEMLERRGTDTLGRGVRRAQLGVLLLELLQPAEHRVVLRVRDERVVEHVIAVVVALDLVTETRDLLSNVGGGTARRARRPVIATRHRRLRLAA